MLKKNKDRFWAILKSLISLLIIFFIVRYVKLNATSLKDLTFRINYCYLISSFTIVLLYIFNQYILWHYITKQNDCNLNFSKSIMSKAYAEFGKYLPGKIFGYAMLFYVYSEENKSKALLSYSMFIELLAGILSATLIFLFSIFITDVPIFHKYRILAIIFIVLLLIVIQPKILNSISCLLLKIIKREPVRTNISYLQLIRIILLYLLNFLIFGVAFVLFIKSFYGVSFSDFLFITGTTAGAGIIGLLAVFVPAGLGVREGLMVYTLSFIMPPAIAGIVALLSRVWITFAEIILFVTIFFLVKKN